MSLLRIAGFALVLVATWSCCALASAQDSPRRTAKNSLYVEGLGNGLFYSLNYERFVTDDVALRLGAGFISISGTIRDETTGARGDASATLLMAPVMVNYLGVGGLDHKFELGLGALIMYVDAEADAEVDTLALDTDGAAIALVGTASLAYRYVPHDGGFNFKVGLMPMFGGFGFLPWVGLALGAVF